MISRRGALAAIAASTFGRLGSFLCKGQQLRQPNTEYSFTASGAQMADTSGESLSAALSQLGKRIYSEEGIPMFLACENLETSQISSEHTPVPTPFNKVVVSAFHHYADEWEHTHPNAPVTDVAKIVELLAYRDFATGGAEKSL